MSTLKTDNLQPGINSLLLLLGKKRKRLKKYSSKEITRLTDGEEIYNLMENAADSNIEVCV